jgi:hypothetical protein
MEMPQAQLTQYLRFSPFRTVGRPAAHDSRAILTLFINSGE